MAEHFIINWPKYYHQYSFLFHFNIFWNCFSSNQCTTKVHYYNSYINEHHFDLTFMCHISDYHITFEKEELQCIPRCFSHNSLISYQYLFENCISCSWDHMHNIRLHKPTWHFMWSQHSKIHAKIKILINIEDNFHFRFKWNGYYCGCVLCLFVYFLQICLIYPNHTVSNFPLKY